MKSKVPIVDAEVRVVHPEARTRDFAIHKDELVRRDVYSDAGIEKAIGLWGVDATIRSMDECGIDFALLSGLAWKDRGILRDNNEYVLECLGNHPHRFKGLYTVDPSDPDRSADSIMSLDNDKYIGAEIIPKWQGTHVDAPELQPIIEALESKNLFLKAYTAHPTQTLDGDAPYRTLRLLRRNPRLKTLIPHLGGLLCLYGLYSPVAELIQNAFFITSVSATMKMVEFAATVNPDNLLFGTDFPFNHCFDQATALDAMFELNLEPEVRDRILGRTAIDLFGFKRT